MTTCQQCLGTGLISPDERCLVCNGTGETTESVSLTEHTELISQAADEIVVVDAPAETPVDASVEETVMDVPVVEVAPAAAE